MKLSRTGLAPVLSTCSAFGLAAGLTVGLTFGLSGAAMAKELRIGTGTASQNGLNSGVVVFAEELERLSEGE